MSLSLQYARSLCCMILKMSFSTILLAFLKHLSNIYDLHDHGVAQHVLKTKLHGLKIVLLLVNYRMQ